MAGRSLPERTADELVTRLFEGDSPTRFDEGLYVAPDAGALLAAVERYCADAAAAPPAGTVVTQVSSLSAAPRQQSRLPLSHAEVKWQLQRWAV